MAEFLLIHGAGHGAWVWDRVIPAMTALGHDARAINLPGRAGDGRAVGDVTLDDFARAICENMGAGTILVGHSMAGFAITAAAAMAARPPRALVYLCAYVPRPGQSLAMMRKAWPEQPLRGAFVLGDGGRHFVFDPVRVGAAFYNDCPPDLAASAQARLVAEAVAPQETALDSIDRALALPTHYIRCTDDRAIPPGFQTAMAASLPGAQVHDLPTGHSPFLAAPAALAACLDRLARSLG